MHLRSNGNKRSISTLEVNEKTEFLNNSLKIKRIKSRPSKNKDQTKIKNQNNVTLVSYTWYKRNSELYFSLK